MSRVPVRQTSDSAGGVSEVVTRLRRLRRVATDAPSAAPPDTVDGPAERQPAGAPVTVLYVAGMPRSGSTLLDLMLGQFVGHCGVGELFYLWRFGMERGDPCICGERAEQCPFWAKVGEQAFGSWSAPEVAELRGLQRRVDMGPRLPLMVASRLLPTFHRDLTRYRHLLSRLYRAVADVAGADVVVDSSRRPSLAYALAGAPGIAVRLVHVLRDPRGVAYSLSQPGPPRAGRAGRGQRRSAQFTARQWITINTMVAALARLGTPRVTLRYEDLVREPRTELRRVAELTADVTGRTEPLEFVQGQELTPVVAAHAAKRGQAHAHDGPIALALDEKWRQEYSPARQRVVAAITWPLRRAYGYR